MDRRDSLKGIVAAAGLGAVGGAEIKASEAGGAKGWDTRLETVALSTLEQLADDGTHPPHERRLAAMEILIHVRHERDVNRIA